METEEDVQNLTEASEADPRVVRVFVSSTFRDMGAERDELVKRTFPALRKLCESRGVTWGEVDLRWGVTDEQKADGRVLPICLAEIRGCRPYFIGLLGERYGWVPDTLDPALVEQEPWLAEQAGRSVTELEILHGVLNDPSMAGHAFFYLRDPAYVTGKPAGQYREIATSAEIAALGAEAAERRAADRSAKLSALKHRIRSSGLPFREDYPDPRSLGEAVLSDLAAVVERLYPAGSAPTPLARESADHEVFARSRSGVYVGRAEYFRRLDEHAAGDGPPLVVTGESGSGKSALLASWVLTYRASHPDQFILPHFIGASPASTDWTAMVRRIIGELKNRYGLAIEIPEQPDSLRITFANVLHMAAAKDRVVLVIDALDQLEDRQGALDLIWLPSVVPANIRVILSTLPGRSFAETETRIYPSLSVAPLEPAERERLIVEYLASYTKALSAGLRQRIASQPQCANPLYLRALLDEIRLWGEHETLEAQVERYLAAPSANSLYELILARYEADYERDRPGIVGAAFSLLWAARRGLSETELLDLLGTGGEPLPRANWSPLFLAVESSLTNRSGLLGFFHEYLRVAVEDRYLPTDRERRRAHLRLAGYFDASEIGRRKIDELPWHLARVAAWQRLSDLLSNLEFLEHAYKADRFEVRTFWALIEAASPLRLVDAYRPAMDAPDDNSLDQLFVVANLQDAMGHPTQALSLWEFLAGRYRARGDLGALPTSLGNMANILQARGDLDGATALHLEEESIYRGLGNQAGLQRSLGGQALVLRARGDLDGALALLKDKERICRELSDPESLQASLGNQGVILQARGDLDGALVLYENVERISRELGDLASLQASLGNKGRIRQARGDIDGAMALYREQERICRELGDRSGLSYSLGNQGVILKTRGDLDGAMALYREQERICRELGESDGIQQSMGNQGLVHEARGDLDGAMALYREQERICRELGQPEGLVYSLANQASLLYARGDLDGAMSVLEAGEQICRKLGHQAGLQRSLGTQAVIFGARGDLGRAEALLKEQEHICRETGDLASLATSLCNQVNILYPRGDLDGAMVLIKEQEEICRRIGDQTLLQRAFGVHALIVGSRGDLDGALALLKEQERICREAGSDAGLQASLGNQAHVLKLRGDLAGAQALLEEQQRIRRKISPH